MTRDWPSGANGFRYEIGDFSSCLSVVHKLLGQVIVNWLGEKVILVVAIAGLGLDRNTHERVVILELNNLKTSGKEGGRVVLHH